MKCKVCGHNPCTCKSKGTYPQTAKKMGSPEPNRGRKPTGGNLLNKKRK